MLILSILSGNGISVAFGGESPSNRAIELLNASSTMVEPSLKHTINRWSAFYDLDPRLVTGIIYCESRFNVDAIGTQAVVGKDIGLLQINTFFHLKKSKEKGYDIFETVGNLRYGLELMKEQGTSPWVKQTHQCLGKLPSALFDT